MSDLYSAQGKTSSAILTWQNALGRNPSPEQRIRIRLALGEHLTAQGRNEEAMETYRKLLEEAPDYPGRDSVLNKLNILKQLTSGTNSPAKP